MVLFKDGTSMFVRFKGDRRTICVSRLRAGT